MRSHPDIHIGERKGRVMPAPLRLYLLIGLVGVSVILILGYGLYTGERMSRIDAPLASAVAITKVEANAADHWVEEVLNGRDFENVDAIWKHLDQAVWYLQTVQALERDLDSNIFGLQDTGLSKLIATVSRNLAAIKTITWQRLAAREVYGAENDVDRQYLDAFKDFTNHIDMVQERIQQIKTDKLRHFRTTQILLIFICLLLSFSVGVAFRRFERRRAKDFLSLKETNERLEKEIEERKTAEEALLESEKRREELFSEIRSFTYFVSHDLRAPLLNLKGFSREIDRAVQVVLPLLEEALSHRAEKDKTDILTAVKEDLPAALDFIRSSVSRMETLINAVLNLSRMGHRELRFETIDMNELVGETLKTFGFRIREIQARVMVRDLPETVADRISMEQIMSNLLSNALNYLDPERQGTIEITGESRFEESVFKVRDNGRGIEPSDRSRIFEMFQRAGDQGVPGEGMGLTYVRTLVRRHGGRIWCESEPGVGTVLTFTISKGVKSPTE